MGASLKESEGCRFEQCLDQLVLSLYFASEKVRTRRLEIEEAERKRKEEERLRELKIERHNEEVAKVNALLNVVEDYDKAAKIRQYISVMEQRDLTDKGKEWVEWAKGIADWFDLTISKNDEVLGERNHEENHDKREAQSNWWDFPRRRY